MNKSVYGKTMENRRNRVDIRNAANAKVCQKLVNNTSLYLKRYSMKIWQLFTRLKNYWALINQLMWICVY